MAGPLQFGVIAARLESEYGIKAILDTRPHVAVRWVTRPEDARPLTVTTSGALTAKDRTGRDVILFESAWELGYITQANPEVRFDDAS